jgi:hypothetical protein
MGMHVPADNDRYEFRATTRVPDEPAGGVDFADEPHAGCIGLGRCGLRGIDRLRHNPTVDVKELLERYAAGQKESDTPPSRATTGASLTRAEGKNVT